MADDTRPYRIHTDIYTSIHPYPPPINKTTYTPTYIPGGRRLDAVHGDHVVAALVLHPVHRHDVQPHLPVAVEELFFVWLVLGGV